MFRVGDQIRVRLARNCGHFHAAEADGRIATIIGVVTAQRLSRDNASAADPRDVLTLEDFGDHCYSVDFSGPASPDAEFCSASEMEPLPAWAEDELRRAAAAICPGPFSWARRRRPRTLRPRGRTAGIVARVTRLAARMPRPTPRSMPSLP
jgi:hypothetical protein